MNQHSLIVPIQPRDWLSGDYGLAPGQSFRIGGVAATEMPINRGDFDQIMIMAGLDMPLSRQVPLCYFHAKMEEHPEQILGSFRCISTEIFKDRLCGVACFHASEFATRIWGLAKEGHLIALSIGFNGIDKQILDPFGTVVIEGKWYHAGERPVELVTRWYLNEVSVVAVGADPAARLII